MSHLEEGVLHALLDGELRSADLAAVEAHLAGCGTCKARLEEARRFKTEALALIIELDGVPDARPQDQPRPGTRIPAWLPRMAWAATIVLAVGLGWSMRAGPEPERPSQVLDERPAPTVPVRPELRAARRAAPAAPAETEAPALNLARKSAAPAAGLALRESEERAGPSISAAEAIEALGGSIRLIDGLTPSRYELAGEVVRVVYETGGGLLVLEQWRAANGVSYRLTPPPGAPSDSVSAWTERIR